MTIEQLTENPIQQFCDICGSPATKWFQESAVPICGSHECLNEETLAFEKHAQTVAAENPTELP